MALRDYMFIDEFLRHSLCLSYFYSHSLQNLGIFFGGNFINL